MLDKIRELPTMTRDSYKGLVPPRVLVLNEIVILLVLRKENRWLTTFEVEKEAALMKGNPAISVQVNVALKQLYGLDLVDMRIFPQTKKTRKVTKYRLTQKGDKASELFYNLFRDWPR